jgi:sulfoxide reductase heme-binding subunit YedZ
MEAAALATPSPRAATRRAPRLRWLQPGILLGALMPLAVIAWRATQGRLGADPVATVLNQLGLMALVLLVSSLACTPLRIVFRWNWPLRLRKTLGLCAFAYAALHLTTYAVIDQGLALRAIVADVAKRPFILAGMSAFLLLVPLALTSTAAGLRRLGAVGWKRLHRIVYLAGILACIHFLLRVKKDLTQPGIYAAILAFLLAIRLVEALRKRRAATSTRPR